GLDGGADHRRRCSEDRTRQSRAPRRVFGGAGHEAGGTAGIETEASPVRDEAFESRRDRSEHRSGDHQDVPGHQREAAIGRASTRNPEIPGWLEAATLTASEREVDV